MSVMRIVQTPLGSSPRCLAEPKRYGPRSGDVVVFRIAVVGKGIERDGQLGDCAGG